MSQENFNFKITRFFLNNSRLTLLSFVLLVLLGIGSVFLLKTTGFPSPEIKFAIIRTSYPGASSETVLKDVTIPLEGAIKDVQGVSSYTSVSNNSFSLITVTINEQANADTVRNRISAAVSNRSLPEGTNLPTVSSPEIGGPDIVITIANNDVAALYSTARDFENAVNELPQTTSIEPNNRIRQQAVVRLDIDKLKQNGIQVSDVENRIRSIGESFPVVSGVGINNESTSIVTSLAGTDIDTLRSLSFSTPIRSGVPQNTQNPFAQQNPEQQSRSLTLNDLSQSIDIEYTFENPDKPVVSIRSNGEGAILTGITYQIKASTGTDQNEYYKQIQDKISSLRDEVKIVSATETDVKSIDKTLIIQNYSVNDSNQRQVNEVISGLIGGKLDTDNIFTSNVGWLLGGIQLVVIVMILFVSWRAAIIASFAIPLSLIFSTIYLYFTGNDLNTLVLFSLVLVIGLVVDPALVILESIQRKIDIGIKGKEAALEAVKDVGNGLFLATLTNIIVFAPFGLISGVLGEIFRFIPLTVIPATIGSYFVPLIFLAWLGGIFLRRNKSTHKTEEENLWPVAKGLVSFNYWILTGSRWLRLLIIVLFTIVSIGITGYYFGSRQIKSVQFSSTNDSEFVQITGTFSPTLTTESKLETTQEVMRQAFTNSAVSQIYPLALSQQGFSYYVNLIPPSERDSYTATKVARDIRASLEPVSTGFFDLNVDIVSNGPPASTFQVAISVQDNNLETIKKASIAIGDDLRNACLTSDEITFNSECNGTKLVTKVDDGFTGKANPTVEILFDRQKLIQNQLIPLSGPATILANQQIKQLFELSGDNNSLADIQNQGQSVGVVLESATNKPQTIDQIRAINLTNLQGDQVSLSSVANINQTSPKSSIQRVKGRTIGVIEARLTGEYSDQAFAARVTNQLVNKYQDTKTLEDLGLSKDSVQPYSEGSSEGFSRSFRELLITLILAILFTYIVLAVFFRSLTQPLVILYTIPLTFTGIFPALAILGNGQFGFLEIIGLIILVGIVENVAIFLIDAARSYITYNNMEPRRAIALASGIRLRPVLLTKFTAIASLAPLAVLSEIYRSISIVIMFGLLASGFVSLITTPILFIFFRWLSEEFRKLSWWNKALFVPFFPIYIILMAIKAKPYSKQQSVQL